MAAMVPSPWHPRIQQLANMLHDKSMLLKLDNIIVFIMYLLALLRHYALLMHLSNCSAGSAESIILSMGGTESMMLSACAESMIVSVPPLESMILSAPIDCVITITRYQQRGGGNENKTYWWLWRSLILTTFVNSASTAVPIGLPPKMAKFLHTSNRLLVGRWCCHALSPL